MTNTSPLIIGISGKKRHGKDTAAAAMQQGLLFYGKSVRVALADSLKQEVADACSVSVDFLEKHKDNFRLILQGWGTDFKRKLVDDNYWVDRLKDTIANLPADVDFVFVPDVRFKNELAAIKELGGITVRVTRPGLPSDDSHVSETDLDNSTFDHHIVAQKITFLRQESSNLIQRIVNEIRASVTAPN